MATLDGDLTQVHSGAMDEDRKLRRQQVLMLVVGSVSLTIVLIVGIDLAVGEGSGGRWLSLVGSSLTAFAMIMSWFTLRSTRRKRASDPESGHTEV